MSKSTKIADLTKEQSQLAAVESELRTMVDKINGFLNQLTVEQFQLQSSEVDAIKNDSVSSSDALTKLDTACDSLQVSALPTCLKNEIDEIRNINAQALFIDNNQQTTGYKTSHPENEEEFDEDESD